MTSHSAWVRGSRVAAAGLLTLTLGALAGATTRVSAAPSPERLEQAQDQLLALERDFELVVERYNLVHERLDGIRASMASAELQVRTVERRVSGNEQRAVDLARQLYTGGGSMSAVEMILSSGDLSEIQTRLTYLHSSQEAQSKVFEILAVDRAELDVHLGELERARSAALAAERRLGELRAGIEAKVADQRSDIERLNAEIEAAQRREERRRAAAEAAEAAAAEVPPSTAGSSPAEAPAAPAEPAIEPSAGPVSGGAAAAVQTALDQLGDPYQWGGSGPGSFDCSGLTMYAWAAGGVSLPHNSGAQYAATARVARSDWQPGDLLFYGSPIHHVGLYIGGGQMVEAPYTGTTVRVASPDRPDYVGAGRPGG